MPAPLITAELQKTLRISFELASEHRHEYVTLEHLVLALLDDRNARRAIEACGGRRGRLRRELTEFIEAALERLPDEVEAEPR